MSPAFPHRLPLGPGEILLQSLTLPDPSICGEGELFLHRTPNAAFDLAAGCLHLPPGASAWTETYVNMLNLGTWSRAARLSGLGLRLVGEGRVALRVTVSRVPGSFEILTEAPLDLTPEGTTLDLGTLLGAESDSAGEASEVPPQEGLVSLRLAALDGPARLDAGGFLTGAGEAREIRLGIAVTTFRREAEVAATAARIGAFLDQGGVPGAEIRLYVVDNGGTAEPAPHPAVRLVRNPNLGGAGGFARGLAEATDWGASHVLFMDDDATFQMESLARTVAFLRLARSERAAVSGAMISAARKWVMWENGAVFHRMCRPGFVGTDLRDPIQVARMELAAARPKPPGFYAGWWFFAFPVAAATHWPFPFFVRGDDISFSLANRFDTVTLAGVVSFQEDFSAKESPLTLYLDLRNHLHHHLVQDAKEIGPWRTAADRDALPAALDHPDALRQRRGAAGRLGRRDAGPGLLCPERRHGRDPAPDRRPRPPGGLGRRAADLGRRRAERAVQALWPDPEIHPERPPDPGLAAVCPGRLGAGRLSRADLAAVGEIARPVLLGRRHPQLRGGPFQAALRVGDGPGGAARLPLAPRLPGLARGAPRRLRPADRAAVLGREVRPTACLSGQCGGAGGRPGGRMTRGQIRRQIPGPEESGLMVEEIVFHLGDTKTGSTSIQQALARRAWEGGRPVYYKVKGNHLPLAHALNRPEEQGMIDVRWGRIARELRQAPEAVGVISAEVFENSDPDLFARTVERHMAPWKGRIRLISYVRPHAEQLVSSFAERSKMGLTQKSMAEVHERMVRTGLLMYAPRFARWRAIWGDAHEVRPMIRSELQGQDVVVDFFGWLFRGQEVALKGPISANESLSLPELAALRHLHRQIRKAGAPSVDLHKTFGWTLAERLAALPRHSAPAKLRIDRALAETVAQTYREDAAEMDRTFFAGRGTPLSDALAAAPAKAVPAPQSVAAADHYDAETLRLLTALGDLLGRLGGADEAGFRAALRGEGSRPKARRRKGDKPAAPSRMPPKALIVAHRIEALLPEALSRRLRPVARRLLARRLLG